MVARGVHDVAPAQRLAAFRLVLGIFVTGYLVVRLPVFLELGDRSATRFEPVGVFRFIDRPLAGTINDAVVLTVIAMGFLFATGTWFGVSGPLFALGVLVVMSHRSSWGQMLHFENLMTLHVIVIGLAPAADAWSRDARSRRADRDRDDDRRSHDDPREVDVPPPPASTPNSYRYGWPLRLAAMVTVVTYVIAGIAKIRYGGVGWMTGDTLRNHIAYAATRLELFGASPAPLARWAVENPWALKPAAASSVIIELAAPIALLGGWWRNAWVVLAWLMHVTIYLTMSIGFPSPLFLVAFAPLFRLEHLADTVRAGARRLRRRPRPRRMRSRPTGAG